MHITQKLRTSRMIMEQAAMKTRDRINPIRNYLNRYGLAPARGMAFLTIAVLGVGSPSIHAASLGSAGATQVEYTLGESGANFYDNFIDSSGNNRNMLNGYDNTSWTGGGIATGSSAALMVNDGRYKYGMGNVAGISSDYQVSIFVSSSNTWPGDPSPTGVQSIFTMDGISFKRQGLTYYAQVNDATVGSLTTTDWAGTGLMFQKINDVFSFWTSNDGGISWTQQGSDVTAAGFGDDWGSTHLFVRPGGGELYTGYVDAFSVRSIWSAPQANILSFGPGATIGPVVDNAAAISWVAPFGAKRAALSPTFTLSPLATCDKASGSIQNFTTPLVYIVTSSDNLITNTYTVTITDTDNNTGTGGTITYTDANGANAVAFPPYEGGYVVHTFTSSGELIIGVQAQANADVLVVAGGGGGGDNGGYGSGGGAGGLIYKTGFVISGGLNTVTVGAGGAEKSDGANSIFGSLTALGGGAGVNGGIGHSGGSGGGTYRDGGSVGGTGLQPTSPSGGYGNNGSLGIWGGGGGGAGAVGGGNGNGGDGLAFSISGSSVYYAGGGSGADNYVGGLGGGGCSGTPLYNGGANTGGGGAGAWGSSSTTGKGGSGVVIVRYPYVKIPGGTVLLLY